MTYSKIRPAGYVAHCQCGEVVGVVDFSKTDSAAAALLFKQWLDDGCALYPVFSARFSIVVGKCGCDVWADCD